MKLKPRLNKVAVLAMTLALSGCGGGSGSHEEDVCKELADLIAKAWDRCQPGTYQGARNGFEQGVGGCGSIKQVRDETSLRADCYPFWGKVACEDLQKLSSDPSGMPSACANQLLR